MQENTMITELTDTVKHLKRDVESLKENNKYLYSKLTKAFTKSINKSSYSRIFCDEGLLYIAKTIRPSNDALVFQQRLSYIPQALTPPCRQLAIGQIAF